MELFPEEIRDKMPQIGHYADALAHEMRVTLKLFNPTGAGTWYVCEADFKDPTMLAFGYVTGLGEDELGHFSLKEIAELKCPPFGLPIERDINWNPETILKNVMDGKVR